MPSTTEIAKAIGSAYERAATNGRKRLDLEAMRTAVKELVNEGTILMPSEDGIAWAEIGLTSMSPLRRRILEYLSEHGMASPNELHKALDEGLSQVSYHVKELFTPTNTERYPSLIELVKTEPRRGALEHYYRRREQPLYEQADRRRKRRKRSKASA